jgi:hypothetical protein
MADVPLDRILAQLGILDNDLNLITDDKVRKKFGDAFEQTIEALKYYCDINEEYYELIALWIIGAIHIKHFNTYPYLFINAMKGSGKTRLLKLITFLSKGEVLNSLTEAVLFRTEGTLGIDEFEGVIRKGQENLRELLNSAYKKGVKVKRMRKKKTFEDEKQIVEEFEVFRPIVIANIFGMEEVLGDRCIKIVIDKSNNPLVTKKIEDFEQNTTLKRIQCTLCSEPLFLKVYKSIEKLWNTYISNKHGTLSTPTTLTTLGTLSTLDLEKLDDEFLTFFNKLDESNLEGRNLELAFSILFIAYFLDKKVFERTLNLFIKIDKEKKEESMIENYDVMFIDFVSQEVDNEHFIQYKEIARKFREFVQVEKEWINQSWVGRTLKRLDLAKQKRRRSRGTEAVLNVKKAQEKIKMFK